MDPERAIVDFVFALIGGAVSVIGFTLMEGIEGTVVGILGASVLAFELLTYLFNPPGRGE